MTTQRTVWPTFPLTLPYEVVLPGPSYLASDYAGLVLPSTALPYFYNKVIEKQNQKESRKFFLDRSVFDLIEAHPYLALTDPKLLGWYLCLSPEDRKIILDEGGFHQFLQRHPALELSRHHVYVKYDIGSRSPVHPTMTSNKSKTPGAQTCKFEMPHTHLELEMLHNNVRENFTLLGCSNSRGGSQKHPDEKVCQLIHLQDSFHTAYNSPITQERSHQKARKERSSPLSQLNEEGPSWQMASSISSAAVQDPAALASFSLDMELERCRKREKTELRRPLSMTQGQSANFTYAEVSPLRSTIEYESPEYYSFDSTERNGGEDNNRSVDQVNCPLGPVEKSSTIEGCQDYMACGNESTVDSNEASLSLDNQSDNFHSIMEDDKSILVCLAGEAQTGSVSTNSEALADTREDEKSVQSHMKISSSEKYTSPMPGVPTCDIMVGTELTPCASTFTQSEDPETADKNVITEVHMADLDYLAEEFIKIRKTQEKLREQKEKMKGSGCKLAKECDCTQRAQRAELCLLALQYSMCRQHCWRLYYTSAEGGQLAATHGDMNQYGPKDPPANMLSVLQKLESDCNQMRDKILEGVPLEQLKPLTVDSEKITAGASYIPAQIIGDLVGNLPSWSSMKPQECNPAGEESGGPSDQSSSGCQDSKKQEKQVERDTTRARRANTLVPQVRYANHDAHKLTEKQTTACKEINTSEAWYDAEEDFESAGPAVAAETGQDPTVVTGDGTDESASDEAKSSALCVSNLPSNVTESDVMLWFEKYCPSEVRISASKNGVRVAIVMVSGAQSAEAAVRGLNGLSVEGHTLHVEHIDGAAGGSRSQASASVSESSQDATKPQPPKPDLSSTRRKLTSLPSLGSTFKHRKVVCISPTAKGTCVPQHYGTMGSFDTLMADLTQLHPDVGRQRIVDALMELKTKHHGALSGLPLRTIREMTSELLTSPPTATQL
ncbi:RNA-binding protein 44 isoform X1 [Seriola lalandi dorsalis]|uniref:RNA-binding protein 44 isoform X1 n=1 Tax=Seriola lalandi dorsalis TaxID=1841481 RepID=UPI000C6F63A2|nr:RNA-binding protein 44 isoform X1 [Seriola lalandi dorsalis]